MAGIYADSEVVELGIEIEKNGRDFYAALAEQAKEPKASEVFKYLAGEEEKHIKAFQNILDKTDKYEPVGLDAEQYFAYMNALASGYVFTKKDKGHDIASIVKNDKQAVEMGIGFEKDSIIFYEGMKKAVPEHERGIVDEIIAQEQSHLAQLMGLKSNI